jgi:NADPH:quinone reductase-like Zn-dependent oxidoreductase
MRAARMYGYNQPLILEEVKTPEIAPDEVLVKVEAAGMCRTDVQLLDGYFKEGLPLAFPAIPGHEIAGSVDQIGNGVPSTANLAAGDQVVVIGGCRDENQHSALSVRGAGVHLPWFFLGQLQRSERSCGAGSSGKNQTLAEESPLRRYQ